MGALPGVPVHVPGQGAAGGSLRRRQGPPQAARRLARLLPQDLPEGGRQGLPEDQVGAREVRARAGHQTSYPGAAWWPPTASPSSSTVSSTWPRTFPGGGFVFVYWGGEDE